MTCQTLKIAKNNNFLKFIFRLKTTITFFLYVQYLKKLQIIVQRDKWNKIKIYNIFLYVLFTKDGFGN